MSPADPNPDLHPGSVARGDWWKSAVVYQVYPRSFADSDGDGVGDLGGILDHLDYLELLGVDVVWLSPVYRSPMADNGYDISDYHDVDPLFGTLEQLDELIAQLRSRDMKLVMDLVVNHTSSAHAWFAESRSATDNPKRDWYWWRSPRPGHQPGSPGAEPTNWGSASSGPAWTYDDRTGEYYLHVFAPDQPDLNWENPEVRHAVYTMMRDWLDRGVDGFRMDVINVISKVVGPVSADGRVTLPDGVVGGERDPRWPGVVDTDVFADTPAFVLNGPRVHEFLQEMHREVFSGRPPGLLKVGETPGCPVEEAVLYTDPSRGELDMVFQFEHVDLDSGPKGKWDIRPMTMLRLKQSFRRWQDGLGEVGWNSLYLGNHDQPRCVKSLNRYATAVARGQDPADVIRALAYKGRDNARVPMPWDDSPGAGFTTGTPWLDIHPLSGFVNAAAQVDDPDSVFSHYRRLIALRHADPCVAHGTFRMLLANHEQLYCFERSFDDTRLLVVANLSSAADVVPDLSELAAWSSAEPLIASVPGSSPTPTHPLAPWESRVFCLT